MDARELLLEEASALAEISRYEREAEKQRSKSELADMRISLALEPPITKTVVCLESFHRTAISRAGAGPGQAATCSQEKIPFRDLAAAS